MEKKDCVFVRVREQRSEVCEARRRELTRREVCVCVPVVCVWTVDCGVWCVWVQMWNDVEMNEMAMWVWWCVRRR